jgi:hypothetical protein
LFGKVEAMGWLRRICPQHVSAVLRRAAQRKGLSLRRLRRVQDRGRYLLVDPDFDAPMRSLDCRHPNSFSLEEAERYIAE